MTNEENKSWCPVPWKTANVRTNGNYRVCVHANTSSSLGLLRTEDGRFCNASTTELDDVRNSALIREVRAAMINGQRHEMCTRCNREDDSGIPSRRQYERQHWNQNFSLADAQNCTDTDGRIETGVVPVDTFEIRLGNLCNLKCRMCNPTESSKWYKEYLATTGERFTDSTEKITLAVEGGGVRVQGRDPYTWFEAEFFWNQIEARLKDVRNLHIVGGEPFLIGEHFAFLERVIRAGYADQITLDYNSNIVTIPERAWGIWESFNKVRIGASVDAYGPINDFIRHPSRWETIEKNLERFDQTPDNIEVWITTTVQLYNIYYLPEFLKWIVEKNFKKINTSLPQHPFIKAHPLHKPEWLNIRTLPPLMKQKVQQKFAVFYESWFIPYIEPFTESKKQLWQEGMLRLLTSYSDLMMSEDWSQWLPEFHKRNARMDEYRGESFASTMPELADELKKAQRT